MKRNLFLAAAAAIALSSCSQNEVLEVAGSNDNLDAIGLNMSMFTTKSAETTTGSLQTAAASATGGVTLYSTDATLNTLNFIYGSGEWSQSGSTDKLWSEVNFGSDVPVYSMHDGSAPVALAGTDKNTYAFTVDNAVASQKDLVYFSKTLSAIPNGNAISAIFNHALARIKMSDATPSGTTVGVATATNAVKFNGFDMDGTITLDAVGGMTWDLTNPATAALSSTTYNWADASTATNDMYILPQPGKAFTYDANSGEVPSTNVEVLCYTKNTDGPLAGWESVTDFITAKEGVTGVKDDSGNDYIGAMYVKVYFPVTGLISFAAANYYNLNLNFTGKIYYAEDDKYYDEDGKELTVEGTDTGVKPDKGEPVNPDPDAPIGLTVVVTEYPDAVDTTTPAVLVP